MVYFMCIDGNIGAGKSWLIGQLKSRYASSKNIVFIDEPLDIWASICDEGGVGILENYYKDQNKYSLLMQVSSLVTRAVKIQQVLKELSVSNMLDKTVIVIERSLQTDFYIFGTLLRKKGCLTQIEFAAYKLWYDYLLNQHSQEMSTTLLVNTSPDQCLKNIKIRARAGEDLIGLEYLQSLEAEYKEYVKYVNSPYIGSSYECLNHAFALISKITDHA